MPETTDYMLLGYVATVIILVGLVTYLVLKARNLRADNTSGEIVLNVNNSSETAGSFRVDPVVADNGSGVVTVIVA